MAITNKNFGQTPIPTGLTGTQVIQFTAGDRVYIKTAELSTPTPVSTKSNGVTPAGWTDLGIIVGKLSVKYNKELTEIRTGIDNVLRDTFVKQKSASFGFKLGQFDDVVMQNISGLTASQIVAGSTYRFRLGSEDVVKKALLLVTQDKLSGKEWQMYHPEAQISFTLEDDGQATVVNVEANLPLFTWETGEVIMIPTLFA